VTGDRSTAPGERSEHAVIAEQYPRQEPGCGVVQAAERGDIAPSRWRIYGELFEELG
jgi:putative ribosome biogenesis GTPase RsgA